jgi:hypothetical protein
VEHQEAIETHAAEGYLLGDLTAAEHEAFEEHFFDCDTCFADVRAGATVMSAVRADARADTVAAEPVPRKYHRFAYVAAAASMAVAFSAVSYQQVAVVAPLRAQLAKEREPRITPLYDLRESRAEEQAVAPDSRASFLFEFAIDPEVDSPPYTCKIVDGRGKRHGPQLTVTAEQAHDPVDLLMPRETLVPGEYSLIVTGTGGVSVFEKRFTVQ